MFNKHNETKQRFSIKKYSFGVASALVGVFFAGANAQAAEPTPAEIPAPTSSVENQNTAQNSELKPEFTNTQNTAVESPTPVSKEAKEVGALVREATTEGTTPKSSPVVTDKSVEDTVTNPPVVEKAPEAASLAEVQGVQAGKVIVDASVNTVDGTQPATTVNFTINIPQGAYQAGETLTIVSDQIGVFPTMPKQLESNDGIVYATLTTRALNNVGVTATSDGTSPSGAAGSGTTTLEEKHALNIPAEAPKTEYIYTFNENIVGLKDTKLTYTFNGNTGFPGVTVDKNVNGKLIVNGVDVAVAPYVAKGQEIKPPATGGRTSAASSGIISVDETGKNILARTSNIQFNTGNLTIPQGSRITYTLKETEFSKFVQTGEFKEFSVWAGDLAVRQENTNNVILRDSLGSTEVVLKPVSVTDNTLVLEVVRGDLTPGYNISKTLEQGPRAGVYGFDRVISTKTQAFIDEGFPTPALRYNIASPKGATLTAVGPDGQTITTVNQAPVTWQVRKPSSGATVTGEPAINGNLVVRYINEANGAILRPSIAVIDTKDPAEISKSKYTSVTPTEDFTKVGTSTDPNTPVDITTPDNVKTYTTTVPYVIKTEAGNYYLFTKYTTDNKYYPNSQTAGTVFLNQANLVANYKKAEFGSVNVIYQIEGTDTELQSPTPTKYDGQHNDEFTSLAGKTYDVSDVVAPAELTDKTTGLTYVLSATKPTNTTGTLTNEETIVAYTYVPKPGKPVTVNYETVDGTSIGTPKEVQADGTQVGTKYNVSADVKLPVIEQDGVKYVLVEAKPLKDGSAEENGTVTDQAQTVTYVYQAEQKSTVKYVVVDKDGKEIEVKETSPAVTGLPGTVIAHDTATKIAEYEAQNYELVEDGFTAATDKNFDNKVDTPAVTQEFVVKLREKTVEITDPTQAPAGVTVDALSKTVNQTIKYTLADGTTPVDVAVAPDKTDSATFTRKATINLVTGAVTYTDWATTDSTTFEAKPTPVVTGFLAEKATSDEVTGVTETSTDNTQVIKYSPIGKFVVTNPDGSVTETQYKNDPTDPTKVIPTDKPTLPYVEGYVPKDENGKTLPQVDPNDPTKGYIAPDAPVNGTPDTPIKYAPTDATVNDPKPTPVEVLEDTALTPADIEKAVPTTGLPEGTKVTVKDPSTIPGTDLPDGTQETTDKGTVTVVVTYPDGTTDEVEVPVRVIPKDTTKFDPKPTPVEVLEDTALTPA
ncbi:MAG: YSIRK-type signal peptide-containing protein, partial [Gemella sp.]|nr:YSIRK-type signal peptide-containing protein [Gemella sp.]